MKNKSIVIGAIVVLAVMVCVSAYANDGGTTAWQGFWNSIGGFLYNALPWNWGNWMGK